MSLIYDIKHLIRFIADNREKFVGVPYITATVKLDANKIEPYEYNGCLIEPISPESMPIELLDYFSNSNFTVYSIEDIDADNFDSYNCIGKIPLPLISFIKLNNSECITVLNACYSVSTDVYKDNDFSFVCNNKDTRYAYKGIIKIPFLLLRALLLPVAQGIGGCAFSNNATKNTVVVFKTYDGIRLISSFEFDESAHLFIFYSTQFNSMTSIKISGDSINDDAFNDFDSIETVFIKDGVKSIGDNAFTNCKNLKHLRLPNSLNNIGKGCFSYDNFENIRLAGSITELKDLTFFYNNYLKEINIPDSVQTIGIGCFNKCEELSNVKLPKSLIEIKDQAFFGCWNISKIDFPLNIKKIGNYSFSCTSITNVIFPRGIEEIGSNAFTSSFDKIMKTIALPDSIKQLNRNAFDRINKNTTIVYVESENNEVVMKFINDNLLKHEVNPSIFDNHIVQESSYSIKQINEAIRYWSRQLKILNNLKK